ncbi:MAG TPA: protoporphyrinogen oxidase HemJ [Alphaproteobacteria bacterium]|nr:protoporphyrinogen oxidase HemJ [Alphaproteobacteria bacterium]
MDALAPVYLWVKALHVIGVIAWMAGLLYLPRLFVYHAGVAAASQQSETFKVMERRLYRTIMHPALLVTLVTGALMLAMPGAVDWAGGWLHLKLAIAATLLVMHGLMGRWLDAFAQDRNRHGSRFYRIVNELPTLAMVLIVILVVVKPF